MHVKDVVRESGVGRSSVDRALATGKLVGYRHGRRIIVWRRDYERWIATFQPLAAPAASAK